MDAPGSRSRFRFAPVFEWLLAVALLATTVTLGSMIVGEVKTTTRRRPEPATIPPAVNVPDVVPARAVSVPILPLPDGTELKIGDTLASVAALLGRAAENGRQEVDRGRLGERLTRFYEYAGSRFILVFERFERGGDVKLAAIYLQ